jgi:hypothetical protein
LSIDEHTCEDPGDFSAWSGALSEIYPDIPFSIAGCVTENFTFDASIGDFIRREYYPTTTKSTRSMLILLMEAAQEDPT